MSFSEFDSSHLFSLCKMVWNSGFKVIMVLSSATPPITVFLERPLPCCDHNHPVRDWESVAWGGMKQCQQKCLTYWAPNTCEVFQRGATSPQRNNEVWLCSNKKEGKEGERGRVTEKVFNEPSFPTNVSTGHRALGRPFGASWLWAPQKICSQLSPCSSTSNPLPSSRSFQNLFLGPSFSVGRRGCV